MTVSTRFMRSIAALAMLTCVAVWAAWLSPQRADPCAHPDVLSVTGLIPASRSQGQQTERLGGDNIQWSEGLIVDTRVPRDQSMGFRIVRTYNVLNTAQHPLALLQRTLEPESVRVELVEAPGGPLPVHVVRTTGGKTFYLAAYLFVYGNQPVGYPFASQLRDALRALREGSRPLTVIMAGGPADRENVSMREEIALNWIANAWRHHRSMCLERTAAAQHD